MPFLLCRCPGDCCGPRECPGAHPAHGTGPGARGSPPRTMAAVAFGRASRARVRGARAAREALRHAGFGTDEMKEIAFVAASTDFSNRAHTIPAIPAARSRASRISFTCGCSGLLGWIVKAIATRAGDRAGPVPSYPFARLVKAYGLADRAGVGANARGDVGLPAPHATVQALDVAVVARGLGCEVCALEVSEALRGKA